MGIVTTVRPESPRDRGLIPVRGMEFMYSPKRPNSEVHPTSNSMDIESCFHEEQSGRDTKLSASHI